MNTMSWSKRLMIGVTSAAAMGLSPWAAADPWPASTIGPPPKGFEMVKVPGGCYDMGDFLAIGEENEGPKHHVCVKDFSIGKFPLSQTEWIQVMGRNPSAYANCGGTCPVESVWVFKLWSVHLGFWTTPFSPRLRPLSGDQMVSSSAPSDS